jgi:hypothetical protein
MNPALYSVIANADDNPMRNKVMGGPNAEGDWQAYKKEYDTLVSIQVWEVMERKSWMNVIPSTWAFKCNQKLKSQFCARGDC